MVESNKDINEVILKVKKAIKSTLGFESLTDLQKKLLYLYYKRKIV